jgi:hydroxylaminobenzene mutase
MESSSVQAREAQRLLQVGVGLFLFAVLLGLAIPHFAVPRLALSAHLIGILQGVFLAMVGLLWPRLTLTLAQFKVTFWLLVYEAVAATLSNVLAAAWGAGNTIIPIAAGSAHGSDLQEIVINIGLRSTALALIVALALILWGLRRPSAAR